MHGYVCKDIYSYSVLLCIPLDGNETNISLFLLPGNHSVDRELSLTHACGQLLNDIDKECTKQWNCVCRMCQSVTETTFASAKGLHFIGCRGNTVNLVEQFNYT